MKSIILLLVILIFVYCNFNRADNIPWQKQRNLYDYLFPDRTNHMTSASNEDSRSLVTVPCVICRNLKYCQALNNLMVQENYYPENLNLLGSCYVLEALGERMDSEIFGVGKSFRDTSECREMVLEYLCLFYGSNNNMYTNNCIFQEDVSDPNPVNHKIAPRYPCRSFCVQVVTTCALDQNFIHLCEDIACPPTEDQCTPDPSIGGVNLGADLRCNLPYEFNPYVKKSSASTLSLSIASFYLILSISIAVMYFLK